MLECVVRYKRTLEHRRLSNIIDRHHTHTLEHRYGVTIKRKKDRVKKKQKTTKKATPILPRVVNRHDDVYTLMPGTVLNLDSDEDGVCHFRIDEVTKNHQNQSFCLMISVDCWRLCVFFVGGIQ